jgi:hypothetical protein
MPDLENTVINAFFAVLENSSCYVGKTGKLENWEYMENWKIGENWNFWKTGKLENSGKLENAKLYHGNFIHESLWDMVEFTMTPEKRTKVLLKIFAFALVIFTMAW